MDKHQDIIMLRSSTLDCYLTGHSDSRVVDGRVCILAILCIEHIYSTIIVYIYHRGLYMVGAMQTLSLIALMIFRISNIDNIMCTLFIEWCSDRDMYYLHRQALLMLLHATGKLFHVGRLFQTVHSALAIM